MNNSAVNSFFTGAKRREESGLEVKEYGSEVTLLKELHAEFNKGGTFNALSRMISAACLGTTPLISAFTDEEELGYPTFVAYINELRELLFAKLVSKMNVYKEDTKTKAQKRAQGHTANSDNSGYVSMAEMRYREYLLAESREETAKLTRMNEELNNKIEDMRAHIGTLKRERENAKMYAAEVNKKLLESQNELERVKESLEYTKLKCESFRLKCEKKKTFESPLSDGHSPLFIGSSSSSSSSSLGYNSLMGSSKKEQFKVKSPPIFDDDDDDDDDENSERMIDSESDYDEKDEKSEKESEESEEKCCLNCKQFEKKYQEAIELCQITKEQLRTEIERVNKLLSEL